MDGTLTDMILSSTMEEDSMTLDLPIAMDTEVALVSVGEIAGIGVGAGTVVGIVAGTEDLTEASEMATAMDLMPVSIMASEVDTLMFIVLPVVDLETVSGTRIVDLRTITTEIATEITMLPPVLADLRPDTIRQDVLPVGA